MCDTLFLSSFVGLKSERGLKSDCVTRCERVLQRSVPHVSIAL